MQVSSSVVMPPELDQAAYFEILRALFQEAPITRHVRQRMEGLAPGSATIRLEPDPSLLHGGGAVHGGILGLILDNAGFFAAATTTDGLWVATAEFKINLLEPALEEAIVATGTVLRRGRHLVHTEMSACSASGTKVAVGLGTYAILPRRFRGA